MKIIYFTGTGHSKIISEEAVRHWEQIEGNPAACFAVEDISRNLSHWIDQDEILGLVFPIYDYLPAEPILNFIKNLPVQSSPVPVFLIASYTSVMSDANTRVARMLKEKNYYVLNELKIKSPSGALSMYTKRGLPKPEHVFAFENGAPEKLKDYIKSLSAKNKAFQNRAFHITLKTRPFLLVRKKLSLQTFGRWFYKDLQLNERCTGCGLCASVCPTKNLVLKDSKLEIVKKNGCLRCLRCVQACPSGSINFTSSDRTGNYSRKQARERWEQSVCNIG